jgi:hypothetical protein
MWLLAARPGWLTHALELTGFWHQKRPFAHINRALIAIKIIAFSIVSVAKTSPAVSTLAAQLKHPLTKYAGLNSPSKGKSTLIKKCCACAYDKKITYRVPS